MKFPGPCPAAAGMRVDLGQPDCYPAVMMNAAILSGLYYALLK